LLRHNEIKTALPPFERLDALWQCDENCLISSPPGRNKTEQLLDGNGNGVKFEIRANKPWLYSAANVLNKTQNLQGNIFNLGHCGGSGRYGTLFNLPSLLLKIGWKILTPFEDPKRFITMATNGKTYGAVAFHLAMKTGKNWPWVWSTFQHINNFSGYSFEGKAVPPGFKAASSNETPDKNSCNNRYQPDCIPGLPNYTNQSATVKRINKVVQQAFAEEQSPLQFYEMLGIQYAKNKAEKANVKTDTYTDKTDFANCESLYQSEKSKAYYVSSNADYLYPLRRDCNRKQAIVSPKLYNPILEAFSNHQAPGNSCISCHVNAIYTQPQALFTGAQKEIFSDFSFTPQNFGIPKYLIEAAAEK
ncbi:MAG: hypothetical protein MJK04_00075, partial [Psychrosphaera sp.]|nr:hypothetical protein [Psychrosphaera sp.]